MFYKIAFKSLIFVFFCASAVVSARADLITAAPNPGTILDFSLFHGPYQVTSGPVQVGAGVGEDIVWTTTHASSLIGDGPGIYGFSHPGGNGFWDGGRLGFTGLNTSQGTMFFRFNSGPVSSVGGFINYATFFFDTPPNVIITAFDINGNVLESHDISVLAPISTPDGINDGAFRGIARQQADIFSFSVSNRFVALDNLTFSRTAVPEPVPEPATLLLLSSALVSVGAAEAMRRRKSNRYK